jgi:hypothetical protein
MFKNTRKSTRKAKTTRNKTIGNIIDKERGGLKY